MSARADRPHMPTTVREITTDEAWNEAVPILSQLWEDDDEATIRSWREENDYRLFGLYERAATAGDDAGSETDTLVAVGGVSIQRILHHQRHAWVHDFVVRESRRNEGFGSELLAWLESWAADRDCAVLALACHEANPEGKTFYEDNGVESWGWMMETEL